MKKKFCLWINIVTICLCVCAIAIGVYAATSATLTVSGQIGFTAHDCEVQVSMTKMGYDTSSGTTYSYQSTPTAVDMNTSVADTQTTALVKGNGGEGTISSVTLGELNFTDLAASEIPEIVLTLTVTNQSDYKVAATVLVNDIENVAYNREYNMGTAATESKTAHSGAVILNASTATPATNESATFTITLKLINPEQNIDAGMLNISANFVKYNENSLEETVVDDNYGTLKYTLNSNKDSYSVSAVSSGVNVVDSIASFINGLPVTNVSDNGFANTSILTITFSNSITSIGANAFENCLQLSSINIPGSVKTIGANAFLYAEGVTNIVIGNGVTTINTNAFQGCFILTSVTIGASVDTIGDSAFSAFSGEPDITFLSLTPPTSVGTGIFNGGPSQAPNAIYVPNANAVEAYKAVTNFANYVDLIQVKNV